MSVGILSQFDAATHRAVACPAILGAGGKPLVFVVRSIGYKPYKIAEEKRLATDPAMRLRKRLQHVKSEKGVSRIAKRLVALERPGIDPQQIRNVALLIYDIPGLEDETGPVDFQIDHAIEILGCEGRVKADLVWATLKPHKKQLAQLKKNVRDAKGSVRDFFGGAMTLSSLLVLWIPLVAQADEEELTELVADDVAELRPTSSGTSGTTPKAPRKSKKAGSPS